MGRSLRANGPNPVPLHHVALSDAATKALHQLVNIDPSIVLSFVFAAFTEQKVEEIRLGDCETFFEENFEEGGLLTYNQSAMPEEGYFLAIDKIGYVKPSRLLIEVAILCGASWMMGGTAICDWEGTVCLGEDFVEIEKLCSFRSDERLDFDVAALEFSRHLPILLQ